MTIENDQSPKRQYSKTTLLPEELAEHRNQGSLKDKCGSDSERESSSLVSISLLDVSDNLRAPSVPGIPLGLLMDDRQSSTDSDKRSHASVVAADERAEQPYLGDEGSVEIAFDSSEGSDAEPVQRRTITQEALEEY